MQPPSPNHPRSRARRLDAAFTLVEVTLAIGVVAVAFVALFGLLPGGMGMFRQAMGITIGSQIAQRVLNDAQQTDFDTLVDHVSRTDVSANGLTFRGPARGSSQFRYFDDEGNEIIPASPTAGPTAKELRNVIYYVNTRISPRALRPVARAGSANSLDLAGVTVQVATNPGHRALAVDATNLLVPAAGLQISTWSTLVARNQPSL